MSAFFKKMILLGIEEEIKGKIKADLKNKK